MPVKRQTAHPARICGMATVFPGEPGAQAILEDAFASGLKGVKLHAHVQCFDMVSEAMEVIYHACVRHNRPLIMHVGREPKSPAYPCDPYAWDRELKILKQPNYPNPY